MHHPVFLKYGSPVVCTVKPDYVGRVALVEHLELRDDLLPDGRLHLQVDHLLGHHGAGGAVTHAVHHAAVARTELTHLQEWTNSAHVSDC